MRVVVEGLEPLEEALLVLSELRGVLREKGEAELVARVIKVEALIELAMRELETRRAIERSGVWAGVSHNPIELHVS